PARCAPWLLAGRPSRRAVDGHEERRVVRRVLLGADGLALRPRRDEPRLDGGRRRAHRRRGARPVGACPHRGDRGDSARRRRLPGRGAARTARADDPERVDEHGDDGRLSASGNVWRLEGTLLIACNCDYGCPCNFNALPSYGKCEGGWLWHIE